MMINAIEQLTLQRGDMYYVGDAQYLITVHGFSEADVDAAIAAKLDTANATKAKAEKVSALANITVAVGGMVFDADVESRTLMSQAIQVAEITGQQSTSWRLANNNIATVKLEQLQLAITLGLQEHGRIVLS